MTKDLTEMLRNWEFDPEANVRKIRGEDGVRKLQVRVDQGAFQGILQINLDGRPDGKKPHGFEFALDYYRDSLDEHLKNGGAETGYTLARDACEELFDEGVRVYGRYGFLMQLQDYKRVVRDTERNMDLFQFVNAFAGEEEDRLYLEKWWPYILRINGTARAMLAFQDEKYDLALNIVDEIKAKIEGLPEVEAEEFYLERERSEQALAELEDELQNKRPLSREEELRQELQTAVDADEFERAAAIRDELNGEQG